MTNRGTWVKDLPPTAAISPMPTTNPPERIEHQRLRLLFRQSHVSSIIALICAFIITAVFHTVSPSKEILIWLCAIILATGWRFRLFSRFFATEIGRYSERYWLRLNTLSAIVVGVAWGSVPLVPVTDSVHYLYQIQVLIPGFVLMAAITSYGVYFSQFLALWLSIGLTTVVARLIMSGPTSVPELVLFVAFLPVLVVTAKRYGESLLDSMRAKFRSEQLVERLTMANNELEHHNARLGQQQDLIHQEEELAKHVFSQLTLGGDHELPGIHSWNQSMGSLSGDLIQTVRGPKGQSYVFVGDFTGHGLPAALGALPASLVFLAMAAKGLPVDAIASELNRKLHQLLPVGYFCCAVLLELSPDRRSLSIWNGGLPPILVQRRGSSGYEHIASHSVPLGVLSDREFETEACQTMLQPGDLVYAYTDGLTEAENLDGEMWGAQRLEHFLQRDDLEAPKLPALIDAVLEHVNLAPASDDISVVELVASAPADSEADAA